MTVWVLTRSDWDETTISGIYASCDAAKADVVIERGPWKSDGEEAWCVAGYSHYTVAPHKVRE